MSDASSDAPSAAPSGGQPSTALLLVKDRVQRYLSEFVAPVEVMPNGDFSVRHGSARVFVGCHPWGDDDSTLVYLTAPVLQNVTTSPDFYEYVALHGGDYLFGHLTVSACDDGTFDLLFAHVLLGDYLDPDELKSAVGGVVATADRLDDELKARFGGSRFHEDGIAS